MDKFFYFSGIVAWGLLVLAAIRLTSDFSFENGRWLVFKFICFGLMAIKHEGNEPLVTRVLECKYKMYRIGGYWVNVGFRRIW